MNYGVGNLRSISKGLEKSGAQVQITHNHNDLLNSDAIVLPGVGAFAPAVKRRKLPNIIKSTFFLIKLSFCFFMDMCKRNFISVKFL